ncbi:MAG: YceI family protein [Gammaproteobacteria bacterium]
MYRLLLTAAVLTIPLSAVSAPVSYTVDPAHTFPHFRINHLGFSTMQGRFNSTTGKITIDKEGKSGSVDVVIDASSVDTAHGKRDDHLRSPDFLNVVEFPEITYKSTKVTINTDNSAVVNGDLTIMGVSKPVTLNVSPMNCGVHPMDPKKEKFVCGFNATAVINRSDYGVKYALPAIGDEMELFFEVEAVRD